MAVSATSSAAFAKAQDTYKTKVREIQLNAAGLLPNTTYRIAVEGVDYGFATRQLGKNLGDPLISDASGQIAILVTAEVPVAPQYGQIDGVSTAPNKDGILQTQNSPNNYRQTSKLLTLSAGDSVLQFQMPSTYYFIPNSPAALTEGL
jgi:hypothetical protein